MFPCTYMFPCTCIIFCFISLSDFIVSDSEDVEEEEEDKENYFTKPRTPVYAESPISSYWGRHQQTLFPQKSVSPGVCSTPSN